MKRTIHGTVALGVLILCFASFGAQARDEFPKLTPELLDSLTDPDATWPHDPAVPDLPPLPVTDDPGLNPDAFLTTHYNDGAHPPRVAAPPAPRENRLCLSIVSKRGDSSNCSNWVGAAASAVMRSDSM